MATAAICKTKSIGRRNVIPVIHVRGTHYEIGFDIGRTFSKLIQDFVDIYPPLNEIYLPLFMTEEGKKIYNETLDAVKKQFPQYLREIEGTANGANVPFHKLFLMHLDDIIPNVIGMQGNSLPVGCSTIICNQSGHEILGHNEDAVYETLNHWYLVSAHVIEDGFREEKFTSLSYAGFLPGYTMGYNHHGLVYSINTLSAEILRTGKTPLLGVENFAQAQQTLRNEDYGAAEGFSVNMTFLAEEGDRTFHNVEVGPAEVGANKSQVNILTINPGENTSHCNKYLRLKVAEVKGRIIQSSIRRMEAISKHPPVKSRQDVIDVLSDQTGKDYRVYQDFGNNDDEIKTIATGSEKPAEVEGQARLYSMAYCPFAHRIRLVLSLKQIPHDIVNINLQKKPQWFLEIHPDGKVPAYIDLDGTLITDSVTVANYLDEKYPEPPLYNDETKNRDLELLDHFTKIIDIFANCIFNKDKRQFEEIVTEVMDNLQEFENELNIRKTTFYGGKNPGMLDILIWPWFERAKALTLLYKQRASLDKEKFPHIMEWVDGMKDQSFVLKHRCSYEKFAKFVEAARIGNIDYDSL